MTKTWYLVRRAADLWIGPFESSQAAAVFRKVWVLGDYTVVLALPGHKAASPSGFARALKDLGHRQAAA